MDCRTNRDLFNLRDEKFDFDVSLSPGSSKGDEEEEDEVFVGHISHKEKCVSVHVASRLEDVGVGARGSWSPLTGDQLEAVCQEAHRLADQLQSSEAVERQHGEDERNSSNAATNGEQFVQDTEAKLGLFVQPARICSPIKRETFCVQDSPLKELPPAIQQRLLRGSSANAALSARPAANSRLGTSSPASGAKAKPKPRTSLRGRSMLGVSNVLPSKPAALPASSSTTTKSRVDKTRLQPPGRKVVGLKKSPSPRPSSRVPSCEDLLSDSASVASDVSDTSLNSSLLGKRTLAPPNKGAVRTIAGVKAPPLQTRRMTDRKNTSSSSSSVSSFNSSISLSPKGKLNSSLNRSLSTSIGPAPTSISRPVNQTRQRRSNIYTAAESSSAAGRRSLSTQARKLSEAENVKAARSTPLRRAEATPLQPTKRVVEKTAPLASAALAHKARPKPQALVPPTPSGGVRAVRNGDGVSSPSVSNMLKPKKLTSVSSMESVGPPTPSAGGSRLLQLKARRPSALPTPVKRRMSSIPTAMATPTNHTRAAKPPAPSDSDPASVMRANGCSPAPSNAQGEEPADAPAIKPFCLEEEEPPAVPPPTVTQADQQESPDTGLTSPSESEPSEEPQNQSGPSRDLIQLETAEESSSNTQEVLLLDLPAPILQPQEKMLIDLNNTPDLIRTTGKICPAGQQLIDLSSPLIKWSPDDKKENNAPLINLSF